LQQTEAAIPQSDRNWLIQPPGLLCWSKLSKCAWAHRVGTKQLISSCSFAELQGVSSTTAYCVALQLGWRK